VISGSAGSVTLESGKHLLMAGKRFEVSGTFPEEGTLTAQSVYALRARLVTDDDHTDDDTLVVGELFTELVPLAGNALKSGETGSTKYTVAEITGTTSTTTLAISGQGSAPLIGAYGVLLDASYEKFFVGYNNGSVLMLPDPLGSEPTDHTRVGFCIDDPNYEDNAGEYGGVSTPSNALLAIIWQGTAGSAPLIQKIIKRSYETLGRPTVIQTAWSDRLALRDEGGDPPYYDECQLTIPALTFPIQNMTVMAMLYDTASGAPTDATGMGYMPMSSLAMYRTGWENVKGVNFRITPEKVIIRSGCGHLRILADVGVECKKALSVCFKAVITV
jgi:hypothetical protein